MELQPECRKTGGACSSSGGCFGDLGLWTSRGDHLNWSETSVGADVSLYSLALCLLCSLPGHRLSAENRVLHNGAQAFIPLKPA